MTCVSGGASLCVPAEVVGRSRVVVGYCLPRPQHRGQVRVRQRKECGFSWGPIAALHRPGSTGAPPPRAPSSPCCPPPRPPSAPPCPSAAAAPARRHPGRGGPALRGGRAGHRALQRGRRAGRRAARARSTRSQDAVARQQERINTMRETLGSLAGRPVPLRRHRPRPRAAALRRPGRLPGEGRRPGPDHRPPGRRARGTPGGHARTRPGALGGHRQARRTRARAARPVATHKRTVERKLAKARRLLNALPSDERAAYDRASRSGRADLPDLGSAAAPSGRAAAAVTAARAALGSPYVWGANGPSGFDCSGLMQWSYATGRRLPAAHLAGPAVRRPAGPALPGPARRPGHLPVRCQPRRRCTWATAR